MAVAASRQGTEAAARALALMVTANGRIDPCELRTLGSLNAYRRMGINQQRFVELAQSCLDDLGHGQGSYAWLPLAQQLYVDEVLQQVRDPHEQLLVCRLAAAAITADGRVTSDERFVYERALARWQISQAMVTRAIMKDPDPVH